MVVVKLGTCLSTLYLNIGEIRILYKVKIIRLGKMAKFADDTKQIFLDILFVISKISFAFIKTPEICVSFTRLKVIQSFGKF